jgi:hypothetical protein
MTAGSSHRRAPAKVYVKVTRPVGVGNFFQNLFYPP